MTFLQKYGGGIHLFESLMNHNGKSDVTSVTTMAYQGMYRTFYINHHAMWIEMKRPKTIQAEVSTPEMQIPKPLRLINDILPPSYRWGRAVPCVSPTARRGRAGKFHSAHAPLSPSTATYGRAAPRGRFIMMCAADGASQLREAGTLRAARTPLPPPPQPPTGKGSAARPHYVLHRWHIAIAQDDMLRAAFAQYDVRDQVEQSEEHKVRPRGTALPAVAVESESRGRARHVPVLRDRATLSLQRRLPFV